MEARRTLEIGTLGVVAVRMLDGVGIEGDRTERMASLALDVRSATATIRTLAEGDGPVAAEAEAFLDDVDTDVLDDPVNGDLIELFYVAEDAARYVGTSEVVTTRPAAIQQLSFIATLPLHVLIEGIAGDVAVDERSVDLSVSAFVDQMTEVVRNDGG